jgi:hypothetical protein
VVELPAYLLAAVPGDARPAVERWWLGLTDNQRREAAELWGDPREACFFTPASGSAGRGGGVNDPAAIAVLHNTI